VSASCGLCERDLEHGFLCPGDVAALAQRLERLPKLYAALEGFLVPAGQPGGERVSRGHAGSVLPVNEAVLDLRYGGIVLVVEGWLSAVQEARGWGQPAVAGTVEDRVRRAARSLLANLEWIAAAYPAAGDLAAELREMEGAALSIVGALPERGRRIGQCVASVAGGEACGAVIYRRPGETAICCKWCGTAYVTPQDWARLKHFQPKDAA
jgi:hypothetical protein